MTALSRNVEAGFQTSIVQRPWVAEHCEHREVLKCFRSSFSNRFVQSVHHVDLVIVPIGGDGVRKGGEVDEVVAEKITLRVNCDFFSI